MGNRFETKECKSHGLTTFVAELGTYRCLKCRSQKVVAWRQRLKVKLIGVCGGKCAICGYDKCIDALEFHHIDPTQKKFGIGSGTPHSWQDSFEEVKKCVLLCCRCHREVEAGETKLPQDLDAVCPQRRYEVPVKEVKIKQPKIRPTKAKYPENLAELVWTKPVEVIAGELGVSGNALARYCKRRNISTPQRGYWTKFQFSVDATNSQIRPLSSLGMS